MNATNGILIRNIFHMLAYAYKGLRHKSYERIAIESFDHIEDLMAAILLRGINQQIKQGLHRDYQLHSDDLLTVRGRIVLAETIRQRIKRRRQINCKYDELSVDNLFNRILKAAALVLVRSSKLKADLRQALKKTLTSLQEVSSLDLNSVNWSRLQIGRQTQTYELLLNICRLIQLQALHTEEDGYFRLEQWMDEGTIALLYQRFLLEYFREHHPHLAPAAKHIPWDLAEETERSSFLPVMISDVILSSDKRILVIDAKFYGKTLQKNHDKLKFHSNNLYQMFAYVHNFQAHNPDKEVSGMLLYAKTQEEIVPNDTVKLHGNMFTIRTLDLNCDFVNICHELDAIAASAYHATHADFG